MPATATARALDKPTPKLRPRPSSPRRIAASRANGKLSRGPLTPQGKRNSSLNNRSHGLSTFNPFPLLPSESPAEFAALQSALENHHQPRNPREQSLVAAIIAAQWLNLRALAYQRDVLTEAIHRGCLT